MGDHGNVGRRQVQEVYLHLDHTTNGDQFIAWYGQCRAAEMTHAEALADTIEHFGLADRDWYKARMKRVGG